MLRTKSDLSEPRNEALYAEFKKVMGNNPNISFTKAVSLVLESPQPRMWVPFDGVYDTLRAIVNKSGHKWKSKARSGLEEEVAQKYNAIKDRRMFRGTSLLFITSFIIMLPSRGFFISGHRAKRIIWDMKVKKRRERLQRLAKRTAQ